MSSKPATICRLVKGKLIDTFKGFVDTFNWIVSCGENIRGDGCEISDIAIGRPVVRIVVEQGPGIRVTRKGQHVWRVALASEKDDNAGTSPHDPEKPSIQTPADPTPYPTPIPEPTESGDGSSGGGGSSSGGGSSGGGGSSSDAGDSCNNWSNDIANDDGDPGMSNPGDSCNELNGW